MSLKSVRSPRESSASAMPMLSSAIYHNPQRPRWFCAMLEETFTVLHPLMLSAGCHGTSHPLCRSQRGWAVGRGESQPPRRRRKPQQAGCPSGTCRTPHGKSTVVKFGVRTLRVSNICLGERSCAEGSWDPTQRYKTGSQLFWLIIVVIFLSAAKERRRQS
jgi:hypothetical protein